MSEAESVESALERDVTDACIRRKWGLKLITCPPARPAHGVPVPVGLRRFYGEDHEMIAARRDSGCATVYLVLAEGNRWLRFVGGL